MRTLLIFFTFCFSFQILYGQADSVIKSAKTNKTHTKVQDSFYPYLSDTVVSKVDTLYIRTLNQEEKDDNSWKDWVVPLISTLLGGAITLVAQSFLKKQERNLNSQSLKETKRIQNLEHIHSTIQKLSLFGRNDTQLLLDEIANFERFVNLNSLYIEKPYKKIVQSLNDYYKSVATDYKKKNYAVEIRHMDQFLNLFNA